MSNSTRVLVGRCAVDSGQIMIADPCYLIGDAFSDAEYQQVCELTLGDEQFGALPFKGGQVGKAVASSSGIGDGYYPVYATYMDVDAFGRRIASLTIEFTDHILLEED